MITGIWSTIGLITGIWSHDPIGSTAAADLIGEGSGRDMITGDGSRSDLDRPDVTGVRPD